MKKALLTTIVILIAFSSAFSQWHIKAAKEVIEKEIPKIQYVVEGEIVAADMYAGELDGTRLTGKDIVWDKQTQGYSYRKLKDGGSPVCFCIASIKVCQKYKGPGKIDTIKIVTSLREHQFIIDIKGTDTSVKFWHCCHPDDIGVFGDPFLHDGMKGYKAIFFIYGHNYAGVSNQIKTVSRIGTIGFHTIRWNTKSYDPSDWIFASSSGPITFNRKVFYSRKEINRFLKRLHIRKLKIKSPNPCRTEKEKTMKPRKAKGKDNPNNALVYSH